MKNRSWGILVFSIISRTVCILLGVFSIFSFSWRAYTNPIIFAGIFGLIAALIPTGRGGSNTRRTTLMIVFTGIGILCQIADFTTYYLFYDIPGNDYWWPGSLTYFGALGLLFSYGLLIRKRHPHVV